MRKFPFAVLFYIACSRNMSKVGAPQETLRMLNLVFAAALNLPTSTVPRVVNSTTPYNYGVYVSTYLTDYALPSPPYRGGDCTVKIHTSRVSRCLHNFASQLYYARPRSYSVTKRQNCQPAPFPVAYSPVWNYPALFPLSTLHTRHTCLLTLSWSSGGSAGSMVRSTFFASLPSASQVILTLGGLS